MFLKSVIIIASLAHMAFCRTAAVDTAQNSIREPTARSDSSNSYFSDLRYVFKVYQECAATDLSSCLKLKLVAAMDRAARTYANIPFFEGIALVKDPKAAPAEGEAIKSEAELEANLPRALEDREDAIDNLLASKVSNFLGAYTLQIKLPSSSDLQRSLEEGRGKKKNKSSGLLLLPLILGGTLIPIALGALALLAGKALIVSKIALILAGIIGIKKLLSGHSGGHETPHVEVISGGHSGWGRAYNKEEAQNLAYQAYAPKTR